MLRSLDLFNMRQDSSVGRIRITPGIMSERPGHHLTDRIFIGRMFVLVFLKNILRMKGIQKKEP